MTDLIPHASEEIVPGQRMSPAWFNALRRAFRSLQQRADDLTAQQAQIATVLASLQDADGNLVDVADAIAGKQDASPDLDMLANLPGIGLLARIVGGYAPRTLADSATVAWTNPDGAEGDPQGGVIDASITTAKLADDGVTYAKMQNVSAASKLLGRGSAAGAGDPQEITLGTGLSLSGTTLNASAGGVPTGTGFRHVTAGAEDAAAVTIDGQSAAVAGDVAIIAPATHAASSKTTPVDADEIPLADSAASFGLKKLTWGNLKATAKTYFDTLYQAIHANLTALAGLTGAADKLAYFTGLGTMALTAFPSFGRSLVGSADGPAARVLLGITSGGALSASSQATQKWDYYEHGIATSAATGASYVINGSVPVGYLSNGNLTLVAGEAGHPGIALTQTGNSAGGYLRVAYTPGNVVCVGGGEWRFVDVRRIPVLSNAAQRFQITYGLYNGITGVTRLIDMICKDDINGGAWQGRCIDAGGTTTVNGTTVPVANSWPKLEIVVNAAGTSVEFFVDSVSQGVITTNIPTDSMCLFAQINKTVGATTSLQHLDYAEMTQTFTTPR